MKKYLASVFLLLIFFVANAQQKTIQEQLGYVRDAKLVVVHADDLGVAHSENAASIDALEKGVVNSASIMVPCPWFVEIAEYAVNNPEADLGLHLTLTSEWNKYKWSPVASKSEVPSLVDSAGFMYSTVAEVVEKATVEDVEQELRSQIEQALAAGIDVTHFDSHMGTLFSKKEFSEVYLKLGREYKVPVLISGAILSGFSNDYTSSSVIKDEVTFDYVVSAGPQDFESGMADFYANALRNIQPGLTYLIIHTAYENDEMKAVTIDHPYWAADWRQQDYDFFTSDEARAIIEEENIHLVTMREIRDKIIRKR